MANEPVSRRNFLRQSFAAALVPGVFARAQVRANPALTNPGFADHGLIKPPLPLPELTVVRDDGKPETLKSIAAGHVTAVQLMFTTCTTTCPMEGAIFERVQKLLPEMAERGIRLLSLSVDPAHDTARSLAEWLQMFHAGPNWIAAAPAAKDLATVKAFFGAGRNPLDPHSSQVSVVDRSGRLVFRTYELPPPEQIVSILQRVG